MNTNTDTLNGGRTFNVNFLDGSSREIKVRQLRIGEYQKCFPLLDDEIALNTLVAGMAAEDVGNLTPESYEALHAAVQEVNARGFFIFATRQLARAEKQMQAMPPEMLKLVLSRGQSPSPTPSPALRRPQP